jgi:[ribosomal protein S5]-alanine N-acetyltransferase
VQLTSTNSSIGLIYALKKIFKKIDIVFNICINRYNLFKIMLPSSLKNKIVLKKISSKNISLDYIKWMNDPEVVQFTEQKYKKHTRKNISFFLKETNKDNFSEIYGIFFEKLLIGTIKIGKINKIHKTAEISYIIGNKKFWNKGIATIVVKKICGYIFKKLKFKKIIAGTYSVAKSSQKILIKNNFKLEGVLKKQIFFKNKRIDLHFYGRTK